MGRQDMAATTTSERADRANGVVTLNDVPANAGYNERRRFCAFLMLGVAPAPPMVARRLCFPLVELPSSAVRPAATRATLLAATASLWATSRASASLAGMFRWSRRLCEWGWRDTCG